MRNFKFLISILSLILIGSVVNSAQTKSRRTQKKPTKPTTTKTQKPAQPKNEKNLENEQAPAKKNERPANENNSSQPSKNDLNLTVYHYEFSQPNFSVSRIRIEHNENGKGSIIFQKRDFAEQITDPIQLSQKTMEKLNNAFAALDFLNSNENYQYEKDYSHLGNIKIRLKKDGRERVAEFNWTEKKAARTLMDEYRKISNEYIWIFDMNIARQNQPLNAPGLMKILANYLNRQEISDPVQLIPYLNELSNDERIPLIARNHAAELIKQIEKQTEKKAKN